VTRVVISGGTGYVGRFIVEECLTEGWNVTIMGRTPPVYGYFSAPVTFIQAELGHNHSYADAFENTDYFVHAAFDHIPGKYRGGEGDNPKGFVLKNLGGSTALFKQAKAAGVKKLVLLSSRAVYGTQKPGVNLHEDEMSDPDTLYGKVKYELEQILEKMSGPDFFGISLRVTGVYGLAGTGKSHKWEKLFEDFADGKHIPSRIGTEVHGADVAQAVTLVLKTDEKKLAGLHVFNVSDVPIDRRDILRPLRHIMGVGHPLPTRADKSVLNVMNTDRIRNMGWRAADPLKFTFTLDELIDDWVRGRFGKQATGQASPSACPRDS